MTETAETLASRIAERLEKTGLSERAASLAAGGSADLIRDIRRDKSRRPSADVLARLAQTLGVTTDWLLGRAAELPASNVNVTEDVRIPFRPADLPRDVPVHGTAAGGMFDASIEATEIIMGEVIDYIRRPPALAFRKDVYALYVVGSSMEPRFRPGDPLYIDPRRPPSIGDDVVVQLVARNGDGESEFHCGLVKELVRRNGSFIELRQYNPDLVFQVAMKDVAAVHRVVPPKDFLAV